MLKANKKDLQRISDLDVLYIVKGNRNKNYIYELYDKQKHTKIVDEIDEGNSQKPDLKNSTLSNHKIYINSPLALESHLRDFISGKLNEVIINGERLKIYEDPSGKKSVEYHTGVGIIDCLAVSTNGNYYVLEFKQSKSIDKVIGQVCRYVGWVRDHLAKNKKVYGVIIANDFEDKLYYACSVVPNIFLLQYEIQCCLKLVNPNEQLNKKNIC